MRADYEIREICFRLDFNDDYQANDVKIEKEKNNYNRGLEMMNYVPMVDFLSLFANYAYNNGIFI